ncbi:uncharacterized protein LOC144152891 isoform X5 [Haemaphysalis longicornis]
MRESKMLIWHAFFVGACLLRTAAGVTTDIEESLHNCCEEGSRWGEARSGCDGLLTAKLPASGQSCRIVQEICCRSSLRQRLCDAGKAAARGHRPCHSAETKCAGDTYRDCCDGCRLGLAAAKEGAACRPQTFSLGLPWDDAFYQCCSGRDDLPAEDTANGGHENDVPVPELDGGTNEEPPCPEGEELHNDGRTCVPVKSPTDGNAHACGRDNPCEQICRIVSSSPVCDCHEGYSLKDDKTSCEDVDECSERTHDCDDSREDCMNIPGSFKCIPKTDNSALPDADDIPPCEAGFKYNTAIKDCIDVDECSEGIADCDSEYQSCLNTYGAYQCVSKASQECPGGYVWKHDTCVDVDECAEALSGCADNEHCVNSVGSFTCVPNKGACNPGFRRNPQTGRCHDINECEEYTHTCKGPLECINTRGSYLCEKRAASTQTHSPYQTGVKEGGDGTCPAGFRPDPLTGACRDIDECRENHPCSSTEECRNLQGGFECICKHGFQRDPILKICKDVNECQVGGHNCQIGFRCDNTPGSFTCVRITGCGTGYTVNAVTGQCEDDDECALGQHNCHAGFKCLNTEGSFRCVRESCPAGSQLQEDGNCLATDCAPGYTSDSFGNCADINECLHNRSLCGRYHRCINTPGSYQCESLLTCSPGYQANPQGNQCIDIDECATKAHDCRDNQTCQNQPGSYVCECPLGYRMNSFRECEVGADILLRSADIDECTRFSGKVCSINSDCVNTPGSYTCQCKEGFKRGYDARTCIDVNECEEGSHKCDHSCINVWGSYQCVCRKGFRLAEDAHTCVDVDECEMWKGRGSLCIGTCVNEPGSYSCSCPAGYKLSHDKRTCMDIDECERGDVCNGDNEVCLNTRGGYRCNALDCPVGYFRDPDHKTRCKREKRVCAPDDLVCRKEPLSLSFNYFTLPHNMKIPASGQQDFFTMRGPRFQFSTVEFQLDLVEARASSRAHGVEVATRGHFHLRNTGFNEAMVSIVRPLQGPQDIQLELKTNIYHHGLYSGSALAKIFIFVTENEF